MPLRGIAVRFCMLLAPLGIWQALELFVLPVDAFTFRFWEALIIHRVYLLPGPFYPNSQLDKLSAGDRNPRGPRTKWVRFQSDEFGQRNPPGRGQPYDIVIIGDSNIVGSHIDEPDTIRARLEDSCNCGVYAYGGGLPSNILSFLRDERFRTVPAPTVVLEFRPGDFELGNLPIYHSCAARWFPEGTAIAGVCETEGLDSVTVAINRALSMIGLQRYHAVLVYVDRAFKQPAYHFLHSRLRLTAKAGALPDSGNHDPIALYEKSAAALRSYRDVIEERGARLVLFVMPNMKLGEESISPWMQALRQEGFNIVSVDATTTPEDVLTSWDMEDDSHWRDKSIVYSARLIANEMRRLSDSGPRASGGAR